MDAIAYARGRDWYVEAPKPHGGFCFIHENSIHTVWRYLRSGEIALRDLRVWLACHEILARRCTLEEKRKPRFNLDELHGLVGGVGGQHLRRSLRSLERLGLMRFRESELDTMPYEVSDTPGRPIPVPRTVIRMLSKSSGRAFIATVLGHLLRCIYYKNGVCRSGGWCKASWIADAFGVAVRAVKDARAKLIGIGLLRVLQADQIRLNRHGRPLVVCMDWLSESAHHHAQSTTKSAPPRELKKLSLRRVDHQKPARPSDSAGACTQANTPTLDAVQLADLEDPWRLRELYQQAHGRKLVSGCEADILAVFGAAAHAIRVSTKNPPGLFYWIVSAQRWEHISGRDEDRARTMLSRLREWRSTTSGGELNPRNEIRCVAS